MPIISTGVKHFAENWGCNNLSWQGGWGSSNLPLGFFSLKFLPLDQLPNAFAQLFHDNEDIF